MVSTNWTNKWVLMMMAGIAIQTVVYPYAWFTQLFEHEFFPEVFLISIVSVIVQIIGFGTIMSKTRDADPVIYGQGRPFQHKLREEDEDVATRKPTFDDAE
ncbi:MAG: hypothetical protein KAU89_03370 [Candidatus Thorarchaeota archaeon]|jgi:hypothetical protein|nr:hypothetical protein [Candidatus Thorarchaeota archaeon]